MRSLWTLGGHSALSSGLNFRTRVYKPYNPMRADSLVFMVSGSVVPSSAAHANAQAFPPCLTHLAKAWAGPRDHPAQILKSAIVFSCERALCSQDLPLSWLLRPHASVFCTLPRRRRKPWWGEVGEQPRPLRFHSRMHVQLRGPRSCRGDCLPGVSLTDTCLVCRQV